MNISSHHAHVFIGEVSAHNSEIVLSYVKESKLQIDIVKLYKFSMELFTIDHARELKQLVSEKSEEGKQTVVFIQTSQFSHQAQHALLKTLEEPHTGVFIIFLTPREHLLLPTLKSRVLIHYLALSELVSPIDVKLFEKGNIAKRLKMVDDYLQKIKDDENLHETSRRDALSFLNACEGYLYTLGETSQRKKEYDAIFFAKEYMSDQGSSVKQLLEYLALVR